MKKWILACLALMLVLGGALVAWGHGGGHRPKPGSGEGRSCHLDNDFHDYDHGNDYGSDKNIWCDGTNAHLNPHHGGATVKAGLSENDSFKGGFCIRSETAGKPILTVDCRNVVRHDKVWLLSGDLCYYPIDKLPSETAIQVGDNGWADRNPAVGAVEAEILFSSATGSGQPSKESGGGGGGCNLLVSKLGLALLLIPPLFMRRRRKDAD